MHYRVRHTTRYQYPDLVSHCYNEARMSPVTALGQQCHRSRFVIHPAPDYLTQRLDYFGNQVTSFHILHPHRELTVTVYSDVQIEEVTQQSLFAAQTPWEFVRNEIIITKDPELIPMREFVLPSPLVPILDELRAYALQSFLPQRPLLEAVADLNHRIFTDFKYDPASTTISTPLATVLAQRAGVCQDFAHLAIACVRSVGLPARYVSGYLETLPAPGEEKLLGADASHAWFAVHMLDDGWMAFDPTNDVQPGHQHISVAVGRDFADVTPLKGVVFGGVQHQLSVSVDVSRQAPRES